MYTITKQDATEKGDIEQQEVALIQIYLQEEEMKKSLWWRRPAVIADTQVLLLMLHNLPRCAQEGHC